MPPEQGVLGKSNESAGPYDGVPSPREFPVKHLNEVAFASGEFGSRSSLRRRAAFPTSIRNPYALDFVKWIGNE